MSDVAKKYRYVDHTWPEINEAVALEKVVILPIASVEDHGYHLPLDTDFFSEKIALEAARRRPDLFLVLPLIPYGFNMHHMDWPGTIHIASESLVNYALDVCKSVAHHGFKKILILNGHGSNMPFIDVIARRTTLETDAVAAATAWWVFCREEFEQVRETPVPGAAHADEIETSLYLYLDPERVQMDKAVREIAEPYANSRWLYMDLHHPSPIFFMDWWTRNIKSGVAGDATVATREKGQVLWEATIKNLIDFGEEFKAYQINKRVDYHTRPGQGNLRS